MEEFAVQIYGRHALNGELVDLFLIQGAVDHFVLDGRIEQGHHVEGLHNVGAVGARERYVSRQANGALQSLDAACGALIGEILALSVSIEYGKEERRKFVPVGDAAKADARLLPVEQNRKKTLLRLRLFKGAVDVIRNGSYVFQESAQICILRSARSQRCAKRNMMSERRKNLSQLLYDTCFQHNEKSFFENQKASLLKRIAFARERLKGNILWLLCFL